MVIMKTKISWTHSTWNPTTGCTKVSAGCDNCYAEAVSLRFRGDFNLRVHPDRIAAAAKFQPLVNEAGEAVPRMVFVNSMSDLFHKDIPMVFLDQIFEAMEGNPRTIFQVLTKRPPPMRRYISQAYGFSGVPDNIWLGVSVETNRERDRIAHLRRLKEEVNGFTAFLSIEPLIGPVDQHDYRDMDWVIIGGESGPNCRPCEAEWVSDAIGKAEIAGAAIWFKQWGHPRNNQRVKEVMAFLESQGRPTNEATVFRKLCESGSEHAPEEKGGATMDGRTWRELPPAYEAKTTALRAAIAANRLI